MKRYLKIAAIVVLALSAVAMMTACGSGDLSVNADDPKNIVITAENADTDMDVMSGSLDVAEGEQLVVEPALENGALDIDLIRMAEDQSAEEVPDIDEDFDPSCSFTASGDETQTLDVAKGSYYIKITVSEKADGTVTLKAQPKD